MLDWLSSHLRSAAVSAASVLVLIQLILPGVFDFILDLLVLVILYFASKTDARK